MTTSTTPVSTGLRPDAVAALVLREWWCFKRVWRAPTFGSVFEPVLYVFAFGYGFGALVTEVAGVPYLDYMATGAAAIAVLFTAMAGGMFNGFFRRTALHLYDGLLGTPIGVPEIVTGEATWIGLRTAGVAIVTLLVAVPFGVDIRPTAILVPVIGWIGGFMFACLFAALAAKIDSPNQFPLVTAAVFLPVFLVSTAFFPLDQAPVWLRWGGFANPMTHLVALLRHATLGIGAQSDVLTSGALLILAVAVTWSLAVWSLGRALQD